MNSEDREKLYKNVIANFGKITQQIVAMEECGELIQAISKKLRGIESNLEEEIADVEIMLEQLKLIADNKAIEEIKESKLKRLEKRLNILLFLKE